jgi:hypothetical protein
MRLLDRPEEILLIRNLAHADSTVDGFTPWWTRCSPGELTYGIMRLKRALHFCCGSAAHLAPILTRHINRLLNELADRQNITPIAP